MNNGLNLSDPDCEASTSVKRFGVWPHASTYSLPGKRLPAFTNYWMDLFGIQPMCICCPTLYHGELYFKEYMFPLLYKVFSWTYLIFVKNDSCIYNYHLFCRDKL